MLTDTDLGYMRDSIEELLPARCHILSLTSTSDGQGGFTEAWGTAVSNAACRLDYKRGDETVFGSRLQPYYGFVLSLPYGTAVTIHSRAQIGSTSYNVTSIDTGKSWAAVVRCAVEAV